MVFFSGETVNMPRFVTWYMLAGTCPSDEMTRSPILSTTRLTDATLCTTIKATETIPTTIWVMLRFFRENTNGTMKIATQTSVEINAWDQKPPQVTGLPSVEGSPAFRNSACR